MAASVNKVTIIGNLGRDPELRHMPNGTAVCAVSIATSRNWKDKTSGERQEETEWHRVVFFDRLAEVAGEYLKKGSSIYIEGRLKTRKWEKDGVDHYATEIIVTELTMLGDRRPADYGGNSGSAQRSNSQQSQQRQQPPANNQAARRPAPKSNSGFDDMDDDIPF